MSVTHQDLYTEVTNTIIAAMEAGTPPWVCPWDQTHGSATPANLTTGRPYRGINVLLLNLQQLARGYPSNRWLTFQQASSAGSRIRRGESGTRIVFFKMLERDDDVSAKPTPSQSSKVIPLLRSFTVFNAAQADDLPERLTAPLPLSADWKPIAQADDVIKASGAHIQHGGDRAFYSLGLDLIQMPPQQAFDAPASYYSTALHELTHWTGHASRCNRMLSSRQHIEAYAFEELVAEMGSAFLNARCGLPGALHHASYINEWLQALRNDRRLVFSAASMAQKAVDFLMPEERALAAQAEVSA
ncbi:ArdC family protein [Hydrogenophaga sp. IBVHS1]|uniref:ArdC family protein n=1 Tax=unclassified Hydrogenophaga TaxID=2610897 RepID=UPI000A329DE6|nr:zincin-like metallopeptidase domain-containing protein [Hydrogenophaga sp. IBVHS1]